MKFRLRCAWSEKREVSIYALASVSGANFNPAVSSREIEREIARRGLCLY